MPYYAGGNLHTFLAHKVKLTENVPAEEADCLTIQMLRAVAFLHENNIAHGDIKPEHVLLTAQGAVKLGGFGEDPDAIREIFQLSHGSSRTSSFAVSSPKSASAQKHAPNFCIRTRVSDSSKPYLPPERFPGHPASHRESYTHQDVSDAKAGDIWACGIIYMFLRSGQLLWQSAQRTSPHKFFAEYLRCRMEEDGYNSIQVLGNQ
ncbi:hypothetical protein PENANT_c010G10827 [Penicillium antarcticum]|uniref:non-specific serine/threonine protein kinase n=1 Tax=Penicillium antarcticum TaxID=416450 RepID=A0A1V6Q8A5_9EURO|nr:hypothetical protein PENANT_c010G10827 [Penicillium antarcticum]